LKKKENYNFVGPADPPANAYQFEIEFGKNNWIYFGKDVG
jgi:hypothetical protein